MSDPGDDGSSLYGVLGEPAPNPGTGGETTITATKETVDADHESAAEGGILLGD